MILYPFKICKVHENVNSWSVILPNFRHNVISHNLPIPFEFLAVLKTYIFVEQKGPPQAPIFLDFGKIHKSFIDLFLIRLIFEKNNAVIDFIEFMSNLSLFDRSKFRFEMKFSKY